MSYGNYDNLNGRIQPFWNFWSEFPHIGDKNKAFHQQTFNLNLNSTLHLHFQVNTFGANINEQFIENPSKFDPDRFDVGKTTK